MNTPTEPPDSSSRPKRHLRLVPPLPADEAVAEPKSAAPTNEAVSEPITPDKTPWQVKFVAGTFGLLLGTALATHIYASYKKASEQQNIEGAAAESIANTQHVTQRRARQVVSIYPDGHVETDLEKDILAEMYPNPKDLCIARIISITKGIQAETGGVLPPDLLVVANAGRVHCEHDERKGKYSVVFSK